MDISCNLERDKLKIGIQDAGIGIPEELRQKVFDRFFRVKQQQLQTYPGIGLGLYITAGIVHRHGGDIWVESEEGLGSTFFFTLPADKEN